MLVGIAIIAAGVFTGGAAIALLGLTTGTFGAFVVGALAGSVAGGIIGAIAFPAFGLGSAQEGFEFGLIGGAIGGGLVGAGLVSNPASNIKPIKIFKSKAAFRNALIKNTPLKYLPNEVVKGITVSSQFYKVSSAIATYAVGIGVPLYVNGLVQDCINDECEIPVIDIFKDSF